MRGAYENIYNIVHYIPWNLLHKTSRNRSSPRKKTFLGGFLFNHKPITTSAIYAMLAKDADIYIVLALDRHYKEMLIEQEREEINKNKRLTSEENFDIIKYKPEKSFEEES